jgi:photosystem II stability/assembly factor-like uncharacterized protein
MKKLFLIGFSILCFSSYSQNDWEMIYGNNSSLNVSRVFMIDTNHVWGVSGGSILSSDDWGKSWNTRFYNDTNSFSDVYFTDYLNGWAIGWSDVLATTDGGENWTVQTLPDPLGLGVEAVFFLNPDTGWIAGDYKTIYATIDGGKNWISQHDYQLTGSYFLNDIHFYDAQHGCAAGGAMIEHDPVIMTTNDGGETWQEIYLPTNEVLYKVQFVGEFLAWACDRDGRIFRSYDWGFTWELVTSLFNIHSYDMYFFNNDKAIAGGTSHIGVTTDSWNTYQFLELQQANTFGSFSFQDEDIGLAVGSNNFLRTSDGGYSWTRLNDRFNQVAFFDPLNGWILPEYLNKSMLHSTDGGLSWREVFTGHKGSLMKMSFPTDETGFVATRDEELLKTSDAGETWEVINLPYDSIIVTDMQFLDAFTGFICDYPDVLLKTVDGGYTWDQYPIDSINSIRACDFINPMEGWVVDWDGLCGKTSDGGLTWDFVNLGQDGLTEVKFIDGHNGFITSQFWIFRSSDGGRNWQQLDRFFNKPNNIEFLDSLNGWVTDRYNIYRTYDGGWTWVDSLYLRSENSQSLITDLYLLDSTNAWICTLDGRVFSLALFQGTDEINTSEFVSIYPNPVSSIVTIELSNEIEGDFMISIFSVDGKLLLKRQFSAINNNRLTLDLSSFSTGLYILNIQGKSISGSFKLLKD